MATVNKIKNPTGDFKKIRKEAITKIKTEKEINKKYKNKKK